MSRYVTVTTQNRMRPSPTMSAAAMAKDAQAHGKTVEVLTIGDLFPKPTAAMTAQWLSQLRADGATPEHKTNPIYSGLRAGEKLYAYSETTGLPSLRAAAALTFSRDSGCAVTANDIMIGVGGKGALNGALFNSVEAGAVVLMAVPCWPSNFDMFPAGVTLVEIPTKDGILRAADIEAALIAYPNPAMVVINAPCNPTGANYVGDEREAFFRVIQHHTTTTVVVSDDPYGKLVFDHEPYDIRRVLLRGTVEQQLFAQGRVAVFRTVSKEYGLAGERVGYVATHHKPMLQSLQLWNENKGGGMGVENQLLAQAALLYGDAFIEQSVTLLKEKRALLVEGIAALRYASLTKPQGTIYGWVDFKALKGCEVPAALSETGNAYILATPADLMRYLVNVAGVCPVPGVPFYAPNSLNGADDWHVRMTFCGEKQSLSNALMQLKRAEEQLVPAASGRKVG